MVASRVRISEEFGDWEVLVNGPWRQTMLLCVEWGRDGKGREEKEKVEKD
jgi:hypothetical protein